VEYSAFGGIKDAERNLTGEGVGTLDEEYLHKVPLPRAPRIQSPGHETCATVTEHDKSDTCYLQVPPIPTWSDLVRSHAGFARSTMLQLPPVWLL
jgi:hypothetical protein